MDYDFFFYIFVVKKQVKEKTAQFHTQFSQAEEMKEKNGLCHLDKTSCQIIGNDVDRLPSNSLLTNASGANAKLNLYFSN